MNREIKFRAWKHTYLPSGSSDIGEMIYDIKLGNSIWNNEDIEINKILKDIPRLMQYTGLKDKNGVEIYRGDIVEFDFEYDEPIMSVDQKQKMKGYFEFHDDELRYEVIIIDWELKKELSSIYSVLSYNMDKMSNFEVIGNIYENKELLDGEK